MPEKKFPVKSGNAARGASSLAQEFATWQAAEGAWFAMGGVHWPLPNPDHILRATGQSMLVYRTMLYDAHVGGLARRRRAAVMALEWRLDAAKAKARTLSLVKSALERLNMPALVGALWEAALFGYAVAEIMWEAVPQAGGLILPREIAPKPQEWFRFDQEGTLLFMSQGSPAGEPVPPRKFLLSRQDATLKNPYGMADLARCFWPWTFKKGGFQFWLKFVEKYGSPKLIGKFDRNTTEKEQEDLLALLEACVQDAVMVIPNDNSVEYLKQDGASLSGAAESYQAFMRFCRSEISIALLGQDQTTESDTNHASATAGLEVARDIRDADAMMVANAMQELVNWVVALNAGPNAEAPQFVLYEQEDQSAAAEADAKRAARDKAVAELRQSYADEYLEKTYNLPSGAFLPRGETSSGAGAPPSPEGKALSGATPDKALPSGEGAERREAGEVSSPQASHKENAVASFSEPEKDPAQRDAKAEEARLLAALDKVDELALDDAGVSPLSAEFEEMLAPLLDKLTQQGEAPSEEALARAIQEAWPEMKLDALAEAIARARFVCRLWGYANA